MLLIPIALLLCSITYALSSDLCSVCGSVAVQPRIFDGRIANTGPWTVHLEFLHPSDTYNHVCSGTIIDYQHILTASHCFLVNRNETPQNKAKVLKVYAGDVIKRGPESKLLEAEAVYLHPKFVYSGGVNSYDDIAIVKLKNPIEITAKIRPVCLGRVNFKANEIGLIQGYGLVNRVARNRSVLTISQRLSEAELKIQSDEQCRQVYENMYTADHLCAYGGAHGTIGGCPGDSGGPLLYLYKGKQYQIGLTSYGGHCDNYENQAMVFTRVSSYLDWIRNVTNNAEDCSPVSKAVRKIVH